jgi:hypothetical protein
MQPSSLEKFYLVATLLGGGMMLLSVPLALLFPNSGFVLWSPVFLGSGFLLLTSGACGSVILRDENKASLGHGLRLVVIQFMVLYISWLCVDFTRYAFGLRSDVPASGQTFWPGLTALVYAYSLVVFGMSTRRLLWGK